MVNGEKNASGSLFLDYRNMADFSDLNSVIYGHHMKDDTMFGTLPNYQKLEWYKAHPVIYLLTPDADYKMELLYGVLTDTSSEIYSFPLTQERKNKVFVEFEQWSDFDACISIMEDERYITLSTCTYEYDNARYVLVGVLRELNK